MKTHTPRHLALMLSLMLCIHAASPIAHAQDGDDSETTTQDEWNALSVTTTSTSENLQLLVISSVAIPLLTSTGVVVTIFMLADKGSRTNQVVLRHYILKERESLHEAHALGGGQAVDDLATMLWVPSEHRGLIGASIRQERAALDALLAQTCDDAATCDALADRYIATLIAAIKARPEAHQPVTLSP